MIEALVRGSPVGVAILAAGFAVWKWVLPALVTYSQTRASIVAAEADRAESARRARDEAWQSSLKEIGSSHKAAVDTTVGGFREALDRHERYLDRFSAQHERLAVDVGQVKTDVASLKSDVHAVVTAISGDSSKLLAIKPNKG